jgi:integrase
MTNPMATIKFILQKPYKERKSWKTSSSTTRRESTSNSANNGNKGKRQLNSLETRLYACLIIDRNQIVKIKTEYVVYPLHWNFSGQKIKDNIAGSIEFNKKLSDLKGKIKNEYERILKEDYPEDIEVPFTEMRNKLIEYGKHLEKRTVTKTTDVIDILNEYIDYLEGEVSEGTRKKYITLKKSLLKFGEGNEKYKTITFSGIDRKFYDSYTKYLKNQEPRGRQKTRPEGKQKGLLIDTVGKYIECLKTFCSWSSKRPSEKNPYNPYTYFQGFSNFSESDKKRKKPKNEIVTLTLSELKQFYEYVFSDHPSFDRVRDMFCFECFTGQRWSDIQQFDKSQLKDDVWSFTTNKTKELIEIDMNGFAAPALDLLKKYDYKFPTISNQKFNKYLKDAAEKAGINATTSIKRYVGAKEIVMSGSKHKFLSSHTARRTCVSILLNDYNMNPVHVMEITGHSDFKTLQKYIKPDRAARREAMSKTKSITELFKITHKAV